MHEKGNVACQVRRMSYFRARECRLLAHFRLRGDAEWRQPSCRHTSAARYRKPTERWNCCWNFLGQEPITAVKYLGKHAPPPRTLLPNALRYFSTSDLPPTTFSSPPPPWACCSIKGTRRKKKDGDGLLCDTRLPANPRAQIKSAPLKYSSPRKTW